MARVLRLENPYLRGPDVKALQVALHKNGYGDFFKFAIDGVYGPLTAHRVAAAKWWLGYASENIEPIAGDMLMNILTGALMLTVEQMERRRLRQQAPRPKPEPGKTMAHKALAWAATKIGQHEEPAGSNHCFATELWGHGNMPWCNVFVSLSYLAAGSDAFSKSAQQYQFVPTMLEMARKGGHGLKVIRAAELAPGDIIVHGPGAYHTTLFDRWTDDSRRLQWDIGGNEGNQGYVYHDIHDPSYADAFIRVLK
jgi:hypothetical protein